MRPWLLAALLLTAGACHRAGTPEHAPRPGLPPSEPAGPAPSERASVGPRVGPSDHAAEPRRAEPHRAEPRLAEPPSAEPPSTLRGVTGTWSGTYFYTEGSPPPPPVYFFAELVLEQGVITGHIVEPNTFGDASEPELRAKVRGMLADDGTVTFFKTYDGTGGVSHAVHYEGLLDPAQTRIEGHWMVPSGAGGPFVMTRQSRRPGLARARQRLERRVSTFGVNGRRM